MDFNLWIKPVCMTTASIQSLPALYITENEQKKVDVTFIFLFNFFAQSSSKKKNKIKKILFSFIVNSPVRR